MAKAILYFFYPLDGREAAKGLRCISLICPFRPSFHPSSFDPIPRGDDYVPFPPSASASWLFELHFPSLPLFPKLSTQAPHALAEVQKPPVIYFSSSIR